MTDRLKVGDIVSMPVPVYRKRRWWQFMAPKYMKIGTEIKTFKIVENTEAGNDAPLINLGGGRRPNIKKAVPWQD